MIDIINISDLAVPFVFVTVIIYALFKKTDVFREFTEGVSEGLKTTLEIFPALFALIVCIGMFRASGGLELISAALSPVLSATGYPSELVPLVLLRPFSGSGAIALFENILNQCGPDSYAGRVASVMLGSSETTFYTIAVYFAATKVKKIRYTLAAALCGDAAGCILSAVFVSIIL